MPATAKARQRLEALKVGEISLVDMPANEEEFLIIKRLMEVGDMAAEEHNPEVQAPQADDAAVEAVVKAAEALNQALEKAKSKKEEAAFPGAAPPFGKPKEEEKQAPKKPGEEEEEMKAEKPKPGSPFPEAKGLPKALRTSLQKLADQLGGLLKQAPKNPEEEEEQKTRKSLEDGPGTTIHIGEDGEIVFKSGTRFSKGRKEMLKDSLGPLLKLLKEVDPEGFKSLLTTGGVIPEPGELPGGTAVGYPTGIKKSLDGIEGAVGKLSGVVETLVSRVDTLEKGTAVSKALDTDGEAKPRANESLFKGVI